MSHMGLVANPKLLSFVLPNKDFAPTLQQHRHMRLVAFIFFEGGLVVGTTAWGLLVLKMKHTGRGGQRVFLPRNLQEGNIFVLPITDLEGVRVGIVNVLAPAALALQLESTDTPFSLSAVLQDTVDPLYAAALEGFRCLHSVHLGKLMSKLHMTFAKYKRPTKDVDMVRALILHIMPDASEDIIAAGLAARDRRPIDCESSLLANADNLDLLATGLDVDDFAEIKKTAKAVVESKVKTKQAATVVSEGEVKSSTVAGEGDKAPSAHDKAWALRPMPPTDEDVSLTDAKQFLPRVPGCVLSKDIKRFSRWSCKYPRPSPPCNFSKSWGPMTGETVCSAMRVVLQRIWLWHTTETGEACPFDFS